jgi:cytochrome c biogenesis protein CcmG, thiol:disulfide interchange protein DsbE
VSKTSTASGATPRRILLYVGIVVGVGALLFAAFALGDEAGPSVADVAGSPDVTGEPLPMFPDNGDPAADPALGAQAPVTTGTDFDGEPVSIGDGDAELVVFMASWCPACQAELPELVEWLDADGLPDGVELVSVSTGLADNRPNWPPQDWFEREGYEHPIIVDDADGSIATAYGMSATPFWVLLRDGQVEARFPGRLDMAQVDQMAQTLAQ